MFKAKKGPTLHTLWMICNIGDTRETIVKNIKASKEIGTDSSYISYAIPFPGTVFWKKAKEYGRIVDYNFNNWWNKTLVFIPNGLTKKEILGFKI